MAQNTLTSWLRWDWRAWARGVAPEHRAAPARSPRERRKAARHPCSLGISCQPIALTPIDPWPAVLQDVSATGVALVLDQPLPVGAFLALQLPVAGALRRVRARVVSVREQDDGGWVLGCTLERRLRVTELDALT